MLSPTGRFAADILTLGFGTAVAMWAVGYVGRLPAVMAPSALLLSSFVLLLVAGGFAAPRTTARGWRGGVWVGLVAGLVNLLVLGSLLGSGGLWVPGFVLMSAALGGLGGIAGSLPGRRGTAGIRQVEDWTAAFARVAVGATLLLLAVGGLVTSHEAGLAVVDWPNSYGYNMFLFPLSRMTGGVYYEHAHRLFGALVGLTTLVLAVLLQRVDRRAWVRRLGWFALALVIVQGLLGGLRVTGRFTLSQSPADTAPNLLLAVIHGSLAQVFFAVLVALAVFTSRRWRLGPARTASRGATTDRVLCVALMVLLAGQIVLGAIQRHLASGIVIHVSLALVIALLAVVCGARAFELHREERLFRILGHGVIELTLLQLLLGGVAYATTVLRDPALPPSIVEITSATLHQWVGAMLLGVATLLTLWTFRLEGAGAEVVPPGHGSH